MIFTKRRFAGCFINSERSEGSLFQEIQKPRRVPNECSEPVNARATSEIADAGISENNLHTLACTSLRTPT